MKRILYAFILISFAFTSCDKSSDDNLDDLKKENQELREALAANSKVTNVEFSETEMILTYSNGLKLTSPIPDVLKGEPGDTPRIGDNGNWWIGDTDTGVIAQGQDGSDGTNGSDGLNGADGSNGSDGSNGADGADGNSPYIGDNGNWWISNADTGIAAMGKDGADGADGVGIKSITYDPVTGMMTITLTNDQVTKFVVASNSDGDLSAKILEDLNGKYVMTRATMGDIPYVEIEYNSDNQISKITSYTANGYELLKNFEIEKEYTDGKVSKIIRRDFATEQIVKYEDEYAENRGGYEVVIFSEDKGSEFVELNSDGTYSYFVRSNSDNGEYTYKKYFATKGARLENEIIDNGDGTFKVYFCNQYRYEVYNQVTEEYDYYYYYYISDDCLVSDKEDWSNKSIKVTDNIFKIYNNNYFSNYYNYYYHNFNVSGELVSKDIYRYSFTRTITGVYELGELMNESYSTIEYNSNGKIDKIYEATEEGVDARKYIQNSYDGDNLAKTERYNKEDGEWVKSLRYLTYTYTSEGLLFETIDHDVEGTETIIAKVEYDGEGNPIEIFKYSGDITYRDYYGHYEYDGIDPDTGLYYDDNDTYIEAGLYSVAKLEYNYNMKNFLGNTTGAVFPELYGFTYNNAIKSVAGSNTIRAGSIEYKDFNDGGYPQTMEFIGGDGDESYTGQIKLEYLKIEE